MQDSKGRAQDSKGRAQHPRNYCTPSWNAADGATGDSRCGGTTGAEEDGAGEGERRAPACEAPAPRAAVGAERYQQYVIRADGGQFKCHVTLFAGKLDTPASL